MSVALRNFAVGMVIGLGVALAFAFNDKGLNEAVRCNEALYARDDRLVRNLQRNAYRQFKLAQKHGDGATAQNNDRPVARRPHCGRVGQHHARHARQRRVDATSILSRHFVFSAADRLHHLHLRLFREYRLP